MSNVGCREVDRNGGRRSGASQAALVERAGLAGCRGQMGGGEQRIKRKWGGLPAWGWGQDMCSPKGVGWGRHSQLVLSMGR